jgi:hypothetical protein
MKCFKVPENFFFSIISKNLNYIFLKLGYFIINIKKLL